MLNREMKTQRYRGPPIGNRSRGAVSRRLNRTHLFPARILPAVKNSGRRIWGHAIRNKSAFQE